MNRRRFIIYFQNWGSCKNEEIFRYNDICEDCEKELSKIKKI
jgi:hypothetical protein